MGDQLVGTDYLMTYVLLYSRDENAMRRASIMNINRTLLPHSAMFTSVEWARNAYLSSLRASKKHIKEEHDVGLVKDIPFRADPPNLIRGNYLVWQAYQEIINMVLAGAFHKGQAYRKHMTRLNASITSLFYRSGAQSTYSSQERYKDVIMEQCSEICQLTLVEAALWDIHRIRGKDLNRMCIEADTIAYQTNPVFYASELPDDLKIGIDMIVMGPLVYLKLPKRVLLFTKVHFERLSKMLRSTLMIALVFHELAIKVTFKEFLTEVIHAVWPVVEEDVDFLGECLKASRAMLICQLDVESISGTPLVDSYSMSISSARARNARYLASTIKYMTRSLEDAINLTNFFKMIPHPDANMYELFKSVQGVQEPNKVDENMIPRFAGILRRSIFASLDAQGVDVRVTSDDPVAQNIVAATYATRKRGAELKTFNAPSWASTKFEPIRNYIDINQIEVKASSKSSQKYEPFTEDELVNAEEYLAGSDVPEPEILFNLRTVNDAASELMGESDLDPEKAIKRFEEVIRLHEEFEARFIDTKIDEISVEELEAFVLSNPKASYLVGTEPKFGEIHKKVTRMFYMAQQELKSITQRVERYSKQICRKQPGVSITKSYSSRRRDVEDFCYSGTSNVEGLRSVFVSFDMSEFSKKFPMELVREFGNVLAELSGYDWLRRIDLVFRASIVIHNSRGMFSHLAGVRGGFEGFFNFIWSSIHASIMEIALESVGSQGQILVFSDDGCLLFYAQPTMSNEEIYEKVLKIQKVYERCGLNFHLGKTMVSFNLWEYLGDVCYNNKLLPMWVKEVCSITRHTKTRGLEPFYSKIKTLQAQCDAAIMAGAPVMPMFLAKRYLFGTLLDRLGVRYCPRIEELLSIVPTSAGGLRITSPFESTFMGTIEKDAEIIADIELLKQIDANLSSAIVYGITEYMRTSSDIAQTVISGSRMITEHPDTSGMKAVNDAIDLVKSSGRATRRFPPNPIRGEFKRNLKELLMTLNNLNLDMITNFIYSTPVWLEYANAMALIRSSGVLRLVDRKQLKMIQSQDTNLVLRSIEKWQKTLVDYSRSSSYLSTVRIIEKAERNIFRDISIAPLRPSPRMVFIRDGSIGGIQVVIELMEAPSSASMSYAEPRVRLSKDDTTLAWASEASGALESRSARRFMSTIARILSHSPESESALINIARLAGIEIPSIDPGLLRSAHRMGSGSSRDIDAKVFLPRWFDSLAISRYFGQVGEQLYALKRADRTTYLEAAKSLAYFSLMLRYPYGRHIETAYYSFNFNINPSLIDLMHKPEPMTHNDTFRPSYPVQAVSDIIREEYHASFREHYQNAKHEEELIQIQKYTELTEEVDKKMVKELYVASLKSWIVGTFRNSKSVIVHASEIPLPRIEIQSVILDAVVEAALTLMDPQLRRRLLDILNRWLRTLHRNVNQDFYPMNMPEEITNTRAYKGFITFVLDALDLLKEAAPDSYPMLEFNEFNIHSRTILGALLKYMTNMNLLNKGRIVVIRSKRHTINKVTPAHKQAFKEAFTATLSALYSCCVDLKWDRDAIADELNIMMDIDDVITCLIVGRALLRQSEHRGISHPYNSKSMAIELGKAYFVWNSILSYMEEMEELGQEVTESDMNEFIELFVQTATMTDDLAGEYIRALELSERSVDHLAMLEEPILPEVQYRVIEVAKLIAKGFIIGQRIGPRYKMDPMEMRMLASSFYTIILAPAAKTIIEYSVEVEHALLNEFNPGTASQVQILGLKTIHENLHGNYVVFEELEGQFKTDVADVMKELMRDFCLRNYIRGVKAAPSNTLLGQIMTGTFYDADGLTLGVNDDRQDCSVRAYIMSYDNPELAVSDYINLVRGVRASAVIFRDENTNLIIVAAISERIDLEVKIEPYFGNLVWSSENIDLESLISRVTFRGTIQSIRALSQLVVSSSTQDHIVFNRMQMISSSARRIDRRAQVNEDSHILQAAYNILIEARQPNIMFAAYVGIIAWSVGFNDLDDVGKMYKAVKRKIDTFPDDILGKLITDISMTTMWLAQSNITAGMDLKHDLIKRHMTRMLTFEWDYRIPPTATIAKVRSIRDVKAILIQQKAEGKEILGNISQHVYVVERIRRIAAPQEEIKFEDENEEEIEELMNLL